MSQPARRGRTVLLVLAAFAGGSDLRAAAHGRALQPVPEARRVHEGALVHREPLRRGSVGDRSHVRRRARPDRRARSALALHGPGGVRQAEEGDRGQRGDRRHRHRRREAQEPLRDHLAHRRIAGRASAGHRAGRRHQARRRRRDRDAGVRRGGGAHAGAGRQRGDAGRRAARPRADVPDPAREVRGEGGRGQAARRRRRLRQAARVRRGRRHDAGEAARSAVGARARRRRLQGPGAGHAPQSGRPARPGDPRRRSASSPTG